MADVPLEPLAEYAAEDADVTLQLANVLRPELEKHGQHKVFYEIEAPLLPVLVRMEHEGVKIDVAALRRNRRRRWRSAPANWRHASRATRSFPSI